MRGVVCAALTMLSLAWPASARDAAIAVPSGEEIHWIETLHDTQGPEGLTLRFRFLAPAIGGANPVSAEVAQQDMAALCNDFALPRVPSPGPKPAQIIISHDGGNYLVWQSRSWVTDGEGGAYVRPDLRESGFWRISEDDNIELMLTHAEGSIELYYGRPLNQTSWNLTTDVTIRTETGAHTGGAKRLYGLVPDGDLAYVEERVDAEGELTPRLSAKLRRVIG